MTRLFALAALTSTLLACSTIERFDDLDDNWFSDGSYMQNEAVQGRMAGDMPNVGTFEEDDARGTSWSTNDWADLQLNADGDYGWAMVGLSGAIDPGTGQIDTDDAWVIGCSGPESGNAVFDEPASLADVHVEIVDIDGEEWQQIEITAEFEEATVTAVAQVPLGQ